jgi:H+/Cl- antiporter ClcA
MEIINSIKRIIKSKFDLINNEKLKKNILNAFPFWLGAFIAGSVAVLYARLFAWAELGTHFIFERANWSFFILSPVCFVLAWWIVAKFAPYSRGSGIPQVSAAIELSNPKHNYKVNKLLSLRVAFIKIISSLILVFGGGVIGREGPTIQISASIFKKINDLLPSWYPKISKQNMIITGAAAGLAAAFNTPLGGIVFAIEELTKVHFSFFKSALLTGVIIAGLTALVFLGPYLYLGYPQLTGITAWILLAIIPLALLTGLLGSIMGDIILYIFKKKSALKKNYQKIIYVAICGLIIASLAFFIDIKTFGSGKEIMVSTLFTEDKKILWYVPFLRIIGPIITFSTGAAGGIFAPALSAGASIGAVLANTIHLSSSATNLLILCGMAGFLTSITRSPFTSCILVLEMTNTHNVIFYIMISALLANLVATLISRHSFYDQLKDQYLGEILKAETQQETTTLVVEEIVIEK